MPTLAQLQSLLGRYAGANNTFADRINLVIARLLPEGNFKGSKIPVRFVIYKDSRGNSVATLGLELENILAGTYEVSAGPDNDSPSGYYGRPLPVQNGWYETAVSGPGYAVGSDYRRGIIRLEGRFTTFADWSTPLRLRIKLERDETPGGKILVRGTLAGVKIFSDDTDWIEGVSMPYSNATVTTTQLFDAPPYQIVKPVTKGRISLYTVDALENEVLVGFYEPNETVPSYIRYKVPVCPNTTDAIPNRAFLTTCKRAFKAMVNTSDESLIVNIGALRLGLDAILKEDASDFTRAGQLWGQAVRLLQTEESNEVGASAEGVIQMDDTFAMGEFANELDGAVPGMMGWP